MLTPVNLGKKYRGFWAVRNLNLNLEEGEIYGFLGPNGAGKTTTILMILSILRPTIGDIYLFGERLNGSNPDIRSKIGVVSEKQFFYPDMTMKEYLDFFGELYQVRNRKEKIGELAKKVELEDVLDRRLGVFSHGMQQKVGLIRALLHEPELLILDEPASGLDPIGIRQVRGLIEAESKMGRTVLISSHLLSETEKLCNRVAIINKGRLLAEDRMENLLRCLAEEVTLDIEFEEITQPLNNVFQDCEFVKEISIEGKRLKVKIKTDRDYRSDVVRMLISQGQIPVDIQVRSMSLEEAFITITKENISILAKAES